MHVTSAQSISGKTYFTVWNFECSLLSSVTGFSKPQLLFLELPEGKDLEMFSLNYHRVERTFRRGDNKHWFRSPESRHRQCEEKAQDCNQIGGYHLKNYCL